MAARPIIPKWEFWPHWFFYIPIYFYALWLAIKAGNSTFFSLANPIMKWGGLICYSKFKILEKLPKDKIPNQILISKQIDSQVAWSLCLENKMAFPMILKPDQGERGKAVAFIQNKEEFIAYPFWGMNEIIIQEYIEWPLEIGVLWIRDMNSNSGFISSLMERSLLKIKGNGKSTVYEILKNDKRQKRYAKDIKSKYGDLSEKIPVKEEILIVEPIGNHSRGTIFLNAMEHLNENLTEIINDLLMPIEGFNYGRLDIRTKSWDDLKSGENFKVLEVNGTNSEPAHIYHPGSSIFQAYKCLIQHWNYIYKISNYNQKKGMKSEPLKELYKSFSAYLKRP